MRPNPVVVPFRSRRTRRDEVRHGLAALTRADAGDREQWASRVRVALESLGPLFASFGTYLGSRIDLLSAGECRELAACASPPLSVAHLRTLLGRERPDGIAWLRDVDPMPRAQSVMAQAHAARLADGTAVEVEVVTGSLEDWAEDLDLLPLVQTVSYGRLSPAMLESAIAGFRAQLLHDGDLRARAALLHSAARDAAQGAPLVVPRLRAELCTSRVLVTETPAFEDAEAVGAVDLMATAERRAALAVWLRQALFGSVLPLFVHGEIATDRGRLVASTRLARLPEATQQHLLAHLFAVADDTPDRSWAALEPELERAADAASPEDVQRVFRRLVPFRDDRSGRSGSAVADHAFLQWRFASQHGWLPRAHVAPFYQSLMEAVARTTDAAAGADALADAIDGLRLTAGLRQLNALAGEVDVMAAIERHMALMLELPDKLDRLLTVAADGSVRVQLVAADEGSRRMRSAALLAALLVIAAVALLAGSTSAVRAVWGSQSIGWVALVATGALLVWGVGRFR
jgi:ubiquinone biosynthesis protein